MVRDARPGIRVCTLEGLECICATPWVKMRHARSLPNVALLLVTSIMPNKWFVVKRVCRYTVKHCVTTADEAGRYSALRPRLHRTVSVTQCTPCSFQPISRSLLCSLLIS